MGMIEYGKKEIVKLLYYRMHDIQNQPEKQFDKDTLLYHLQYAIDLVENLKVGDE